MSLVTRLLSFVLSLTLLAGIGLIGYLVWTNTPSAPNPGNAPTVDFRSVEMGDAVTVSVDVRGNNVVRAELWSGDQLLARELNPNPAVSSDWSAAWQWTPPKPGVYPLAARAFDAAGRYGASSLFEVVVPPRQRLLFSSNRTGRYTLYSIAPDTREAAVVASTDSQDRQPRVSSSGVVAFASNGAGGWHIVTRALKGGERADLTPDLLSAQRPVWSNDGQRLAFEVTISNTTNIFTTDARGQNRFQVTGGDGYDGQASYSPDGTRMVFAGNTGGQWNLYSVDADGKNLARISNDSAQDWQPAWSPEGSRIAFASNRSGISQIYVMQVGGTGEAVRLTNFPSGAEQPAWSGDGNWLAFVAYTGAAEGENRREIYLLYVPKDQPPIEGLGLIRLTQNSFDDTEPAWVAP